MIQFSQGYAYAVQVECLWIAGNTSTAAHLTYTVQLPCRGLVKAGARTAAWSETLAGEEASKWQALLPASLGYPGLQLHALLYFTPC